MPLPTYGSQSLAVPVTVFVNGIVARNLSGFLWLWRHLLSFRRALKKAPGCRQVKAGIVSFNELVLVSYWDSKGDLDNFFKSAAHRPWMQYISKHPKALSLYNETHSATQSGRYLGKPHGLGLYHDV